MKKYKIEIIDKLNSDKYFQLQNLIRKFAIHVYIVQKFNLSNKNNNDKYEYINNYKKYIEKEDCEFLEQDIKSRLEFLEQSIINKDNNKKTRHYILLMNDQVIGFQTAQVRNNNGIIEGWRNFAYIEQQYIGKNEAVINYYGQNKFGNMSNIIYEDITQWFKEDGVVFEKTATGKNMYKNILMYVIFKEFNIDHIDNSRIYLIKDVRNITSKKERIAQFKAYLHNCK